MSCAFLWEKGLNAKDIHKEIFYVFGGKCFSRKAVQNWVEKFSQGRWKITDDVEVAGTTVNRIVCCRFRHTGKAMEQMYQCWLRICREIIFFRFEYHMFYVVYPFVTYLLTLPRTSFSPSVASVLMSADTSLLYTKII
jgi:hypothetical protein